MYGWGMWGEQVLLALLQLQGSIHQHCGSAPYLVDGVAAGHDVDGLDRVKQVLKAHGAVLRMCQHALLCQQRFAWASA